MRAGVAIPKLNSLDPLSSIMSLQAHHRQQHTSYQHTSYHKQATNICTHTHKLQAHATHQHTYVQATSTHYKTHSSKHTSHMHIMCHYMSSYKHIRCHYMSSYKHIRTKVNSRHIGHVNDTNWFGGLVHCVLLVIAKGTIRPHHKVPLTPVPSKDKSNSH